MRGFIDTAVGDARHLDGKAVTPFILGRIGELTGGRSLRTNIALAASNARLAGEIAEAMLA
jgi:pseudouridine-5'-phosphate glycosidase